MDLDKFHQSTLTIRPTATIRVGVVILQLNSHNQFPTTWYKFVNFVVHVESQAHMLIINGCDRKIERL